MAKSRVLLSIRQYAKDRGISHTAVNKAVKAGRLHLVDGKIDPAAADKEWAKNTRVWPGGRKTKEEPPTDPPKLKLRNSEDPGGPPTGSLAHAQLVKEQARAKRAVLEVERMEAQLVDAEEVAQAWAAMIQTAKNKALMLPSELAPKLAVESDAVACEALLKAGIHAMLSELSGYRPDAA